MKDDPILTGRAEDFVSAGQLMAMRVAAALLHADDLENPDRGPEAQYRSEQCGFLWRMKQFRRWMDKLIDEVEAKGVATGGDDVITVAHEREMTARLFRMLADELEKVE